LVPQKQENKEQNKPITELLWAGLYYSLQQDWLSEEFLPSGREK
jgi:hypothetical protein